MRHYFIAHRDPKEYYRCLEVSHDAPLDEIRRAYRRLTKRFHPDHNQADGAKERFLEINQAWRTVGNAERRAIYDSLSRLDIAFDRLDPENVAPQPLTCDCCNRRSAQLRFIAFRDVSCWSLPGRAKETGGVWCRDCAATIARAVARNIAAKGWRNPLGLFFALCAILLRGSVGRMPRSENFWLLLHQARAFLFLGEERLSAASAADARLFASARREKTAAARAIFSSVAPGARFKTVWRKSPFRRCAGAALILFATLFALSRDALAPPPFIPPPPEPHYAAVDRLIVRSAPSNAAAIEAILKRFDPALVVDAAMDEEWAGIETSSGRKGFVLRRYLFRGDGESARIRWCAARPGPPPRNGQVFFAPDDGKGALLVDNQSGQDAIVKLMGANGRTLMAFYIAKGQKSSVQPIPDQAFYPVWSLGEKFSPDCQIFLKNARFFSHPGFGPDNRLLVLPDAPSTDDAYPETLFAFLGNAPH